MNDLDVVRAIIFLTAGLTIILIPKQNLLNFQVYLIDKFHTKYGAERDRKNYRYLGMFSIFISLILFAFSIIY